MKPIAETVESMFASRSIQEDEYLNENDGLIYCSKCHTPRQHKILSKCMIQFSQCTSQTTIFQCISPQALIPLR